RHTRSKRDWSSDVCSSDLHRLRGGSLGWHLRFEARAAARFSRIYRAVHGRAPAISIIHCVKSIHTLPTASGERPIVEFLSSREQIGRASCRERVSLTVVHD